jgi:two-component sensor histidine kinase
VKIPVARLQVQDDHDLLRVRRHARLIADAAGLTVRDQTRLITALSEIARNAIQHGRGGEVDFVLRHDAGENLLEAQVRDQGPGIGDVERVLKERFAERSGAGLGVAGSRRLVHRFIVDTGPHGTSITLGMRMPSADPAAIESAARNAIDAVAEAVSENPHEELVHQNRALVESLAEKDFLIREIHHRVKNNFQLISSLARIQARRAKGAEAKTLLESLAMRIRALGLAHEQLYLFDDLTQVGLKSFVGQLCASLRAAFVSPEQQIEIRCDLRNDILLNQDQAMDVGIILNELVTNSIKHAFPGHRSGEIVIESDVTDNELALTVRDDGVGHPDLAGMAESGESLGLRLLQSSVRKLGGDVTFLESIRGAAVRITVPGINGQARAFQSVI